MIGWAGEDGFMKWSNTPICVVLIVLCGCGGPAQLGPDAETFKAVDALYTAVSLRAAGELDKCAARLRELEEKEKLPEGASRELSGIEDDARSGKWEPAQQRLANFMRGQRRAR